MAPVLDIRSRPKGLIVITGPTASGKSGIAVRCVEYLQDNFNIKSEIINADSIQLYNELKILTAYPSDNSLNRAEHHLYGLLSPNENSPFSTWLKLVKEKIHQLDKKNKIAIICGGTGFYINALINGISNIPEIPQDFRDNALKRFQELGREEFFNQLTALDPQLCKTLHKNNTQRILRAYEVVSYTKKPLSEWWKEEKKRRYKTLPIILLPQRDKLNEKCWIRIKKMILNGAVEEVKNFTFNYPNYNGPLCNVIGYCEIISFLNKEISLSKCTELMYIKTKRYTKRQSTWFRNQLNPSKVINKFGEEIKNISDFLAQEPLG